jgi:cysteine-rich repeat protein
MKAAAVFSLLLFSGLALGVNYCDNYEPGVKVCTSDTDCALSGIGFCNPNAVVYNTSCITNITCSLTADCPNNTTCNGTYCGANLLGGPFQCGTTYDDGACNAGLCSNYASKSCASNDTCVVGFTSLNSVALPATYSLGCFAVVNCSTDSDCPNELPCSSGECGFGNDSYPNCTCPYPAYADDGICRSCGNGVLNSTTEQCDDFNWDNGDGCDENCVCEAIAVVDGQLSTENSGVCVIGDILTFKVNFTLGNDYSVATAVKCYGSGTEFDGICLGEECTCFVEVGSADMATAGTSGSTDFSVLVTIGNSGCAANTTTLSHSITLTRQTCGCSVVSVCNDTADTEDIVVPVIAGGLICVLALLGLFISLRRKQRYSQVPY